MSGTPTELILELVAVSTACRVTDSRINVSDDHIAGATYPLRLPL